MCIHYYIGQVSACGSQPPPLTERWGQMYSEVGSDSEKETFWRKHPGGGASDGRKSLRILQTVAAFLLKWLSNIRLQRGSPQASLPGQVRMRELRLPTQATVIVQTILFNMRLPARRGRQEGEKPLTVEGNPNYCMVIWESMEEYWYMCEST